MSLQGIGVSTGVAAAPIVKVVPAKSFDPTEPPTTDVESATAQIKAALANVGEQLLEAAQKAPETSRKVIEATAQLTGDRGLLKTIVKKLKAGTGRTRAVHDAIDDYVAKFQKIGGYFAERTTDLIDIRNRTIAELLGVAAPGVPHLTEPTIIVAEDLAPADTATMNPNVVVGILTQSGGVTSHTAILAAQLGIPAAVQVAGVMELTEGTRVGVDGGSGEVFVDPSLEQIQALEAKSAKRTALLDTFDGPGATKDGHKIQLLANIGTAQDAIMVAGEGVEGIGLFRTEFLFLDRQQAPTLEEQTQTYTRAMREFTGKKFVARTIDAGADKPLAFANQGTEENPALGVRGLRLSMRSEYLLDTQLQALAAAQAETGAHLWVMAPMVGTREEAQWFTDRARQAGLDMVGIMVEVPAAALRSSTLLEVADFASIGTNDLAQYTMAADRLNGSSANLLSAWQPAIIELVAHTCAGGTGHTPEPRPVGICGESGGDPLLALVYAGLGVTSLSMAVRKVPAVRAALALHDLATCQKMARAALAAPTAEAARQAVLDLAAPEMSVIA